MPGKDVDATALREQYVDVLQRYEGVRYYWGGENRFGIDCSGLVRKGFIVAQFEQGMAEFEAGLIRNGLRLWWYDASAKAMKNGYRGETELLFQAEGINSIDYSRIQPGDFVVTEDGVHTLAYLGDETWIQAEPGLTKVIISKDRKTPWYDIPVSVIRWKVLSAVNKKNYE